MTLYTIVLVSLVAHFSLAKILHDYQELDNPNAYDFIIVGGSLVYFAYIMSLKTD